VDLVFRHPEIGVVHAERAEDAFTEEFVERLAADDFDNGAEIDLGYVSLPSAALDDPDEAVTWGRKALAVARAKAAAKPIRKRKKP
jgi:TfoX/Sxy family transcriptional regulator of competence genes